MTVVGPVPHRFLTRGVNEKGQVTWMVIELDEKKKIVFDKDFGVNLEEARRTFEERSGYPVKPFMNSELGLDYIKDQKYQDILCEECHSWYVWAKTDKLKPICPVCSPKNKSWPEEV